MIRIILVVFGGFAAVGALLVLSVYWRSEARLRDYEAPPPFTAEIPADAASIAKGEHIARTRGCFGCHGQRLEGRDFSDMWDWAKLPVAPNLAKVAQENDPAALEAAIRHGIGTDGRAMYSMPSYNWAHLNNEDLAALISFLRSVPVADNKLPRAKLGWALRWRLIYEDDPTAADLVAQVPPLRYADTDDPVLRHGEYLAMTMCNECHGFDLRGDQVFGNTPDLAMVAAYELEDFTKLMRECEPMGGSRDIGLMGLVCGDRFYALTDMEVADLHAFLSTLYLEPVPENVPWR